MVWIWKEEPVSADDSGLRENAHAEAFQAATKGPKHRFRNWLLYGIRPEPVPSHFGAVEPPEEGKAGICCSGGGIRSAAFSLGALQVLQKEDELQRASYLAAVSGGSYIASAISMVAKTGKAEPGEPNKNSEQPLLDRMGPFAPGSPEEQYLRNRCAYLAPTLTDKIFLGWRVILGLLINLLYISMPLIGGALLLTSVLYAPFLSDLAGACDEGVGICMRECATNLPLGFWLLPLLALALSVVFGLTTLLGRWRSEEVERFFTVWSARLLILAGILALMLIAVPYLVDWVRGFGDDGESAGGVAADGAAKIGAGTLALLVGVVAQLGHLLTSKEASEGFGRARKFFEKLGKAARLAVTYFAAALVGPLLLFAIFVLAVAAGMSEARTDGQIDLAVGGVGLGILAAFAVAYYFADLTTWSLNPYYKRRLSSVFALKRISEENLAEPEERDRVEALKSADPETDVGIAIERDFDDLVPISRSALQGGEGRKWPTLLICAAANISDSGATPPGRGVTSFTFSANTVGGPLVGAVRTWELESAFKSREEAFPDAPPQAREEEGPLEKAVTAVKPNPVRNRRRDLTLPAAMAMSGAAISPSMGKMTRRPLTFLMALANIRLGVWVPNPRWISEFEKDKSLRKRYTRPRLLYLLWELIGINRVDDKYLYVTDGGHYENLGLVELLRRGCTEIYCLDASGVGRDGVEFEALGEAIALARSELGVEIKFDAEQEERDPEQLIPDKETYMAKRDVVTATIAYPPQPDGESAPEGKLIYVRNTMTDKVPWDVRAHHQADPRFPNNPTIDQLYTDQKFEAYRALGAGAGERAVEQMKAP